jgi:hypothetical protein
MKTSEKVDATTGDNASLSLSLEHRPSFSDTGMISHKVELRGEREKEARGSGGAQITSSVQIGRWRFWVANRFLSLYICSGS